jgi:hypothetical protein
LNFTTTVVNLESLPKNLNERRSVNAPLRFLNFSTTVLNAEPLPSGKAGACTRFEMTKVSGDGGKVCPWA